MSRHQDPSLKDRLLRRTTRAEAGSASLEPVEQGCVQPVGDLRAQARGFFKPLA